MLMVGAKVLFNSAKMLVKMGVLVVFMHDYGHYVSLITLRESVTFFITSHCLVTTSGGC